MVAMLTHYRELFARVRKYPGMFGVKTYREMAGLTGILTEYRVGDGCYDLAVRAGRFRATRPHHGLPDHVAGFSPDGEHIHVTDGRID